MSRTVLFGLAAIGCLTFLPATGRAQEKKTAERPAIAVINVGVVLQKYEKVGDSRVQIEKILQPMREEAERLKRKALDFKKLLDRRESSDDLKEQCKLGLRETTRRLFDLDEQARTKVTKAQELQLIAFHKEVHEATAKYAQENGIVLVLAAAEKAPDDPDAALLRPADIERKLTDGALTPFYVHSSADITQAVVDRLNQAYRLSRKDSEP